MANTAVQILRRVPPNTPSSVSATVITKDESAVTGGQSQVMLIGTPDGRIADLRKQKEAVMLLSSTHDADDMSYYAILFKRTMESDISAATSTFERRGVQNEITEQEKEEKLGSHGLRANMMASVSS